MGLRIFFRHQVDFRLRFFRFIVPRETEVLQGLYLVLLFAVQHRLFVSLLLVGYNPVLCGQGYVGVEAAHAFHVHILFAGGGEYQVHTPGKGKEHQREDYHFPALLHLLRGKFPFGVIFLFRLPVRLRYGRAVLILLYFFHIPVCLRG